MEYHCTKAVDIAARIFNNGMKLFSAEIEFVDRYLAFLISINDESSASPSLHVISAADH